MRDYIRDRAKQQFRELGQSARIIVVRPEYFPRDLLLETLVEWSPSVYLRIPDADLADDLDLLLSSAIAQQNPGTTIADQAAVIVDECDKADPAQLELFITRQISAGKRLIILSRQIPPCLRLGSDLSAQASFIPADHSRMLLDYARLRSEQALLEVRVLGSGRVILNGREILDWDGALPRALFFFLVDRGMTTRGQIFETFWPLLTLREATNVFHVTKRKISEVLGIDLTVYWSGFYRISPDIRLEYDAAVFTELVQASAVTSADESEGLLSSALWMYRGHYLTGMEGNAAWAENRRVEIMQTYGDALIALGKLREQAGDLEAALGLYIRASAVNPFREDLAGAVMGLYRDAGMLKDALDSYQRLEQEIVNRLGIAPVQWLQDLAGDIQRQSQSVAEGVAKRPART